MNLKEYLTTLSKENLISLLMDLADINMVRQYQLFRLYRK